MLCTSLALHTLYSTRSAYFVLHLLYIICLHCTCSTDTTGPRTTDLHLALHTLYFTCSAYFVLHLLYITCLHKHNRPTYNWPSACFAWDWLLWVPDGCSRRRCLPLWSWAPQWERPLSPACASAVPHHHDCRPPLDHAAADGCDLHPWCGSFGTLQNNNWDIHDAGVLGPCKTTIWDIHDVGVWGSCKTTIGTTMMWVLGQCKKQTKNWDIHDAGVLESCKISM